MKIYIDGTAAPENGDTLMAETRCGLNDVKVYRNINCKYWIFVDSKIANKQAFDAEETIHYITQLLETSMLQKCKS